MAKATKRSIKLYETEIKTLLSLPDEQCCRILRALLANSVGEGLPELDAMEAAVYTLVNGQVERADELSRKRAQAVNTRWEADTNGDKDGETGESGSYNPVQRDTNPYTNTNTNTSTITKTNTATNTDTITGGAGETAVEQAEASSVETAASGKKQRGKMAEDRKSTRLNSSH